MAHSGDTLDLREIGAALRHGGRWVAGGALFGLLVGATSLAVLDRQYEASATVLLRNQAGGGSSALALSRLSGVLGGLPGGIGGAAVETEQEILTSRVILGEVADSLGLQVRVLEPKGARTRQVFSLVRVDPDAADARYRFERRGARYEVEGPGASGAATPGEPFRVPGAVFVLQGEGLPERFTVAVSDRFGAIVGLEKRLTADVAGGEVVKLSFRADEPGLAAQVPNTMIARYLQRRKTSDRGVNQHRFEFLTAHTDSIAAQLSAAQSALRRHQEATGVLDPTLTAQTEVERAMMVQAELETAEVETRALRRILAKGGAEGFSPRELAAYPTFLGNPAINDVLSRLLRLETDRIALLEKRTELDPDVVAISASIDHLESRLVTLSRDYLNGLSSREEELRRELGEYRTALNALPGYAEESLHRQREVKRLSETLIVLQSQLVEARLAAIGEGGDVRQLDVAVPPRRPAFPNPVLNLLGGLLGGLFFGVVAAVGAARVRQEVREPWEAELGTGVPSVTFDPRLPLWLGGLGEARTALVFSTGRSADPAAVAEQLVATATLRGRPGMVADLAHSVVVSPPSRITVAPPVRVGGTGSGGAADFAGDSHSPASPNGASATAPRAVLEELEARHDFVAAILAGLDSPGTVSVMTPERPVVLVARAGRIDRAALQEAVGVCERLGVPVAGIVLQPPKNGRRA